MTNTNCGYLYIASGAKSYFDEAYQSIQSLRRHDPLAHITLICDDCEKISRELRENVDNIIIEPCKVSEKKIGWLFKARTIYKLSPYEKTFFLDTDTYIIDNVRELFTLLDFFDMCLCHGSVDRSKIYLKGQEIIGYTPYNSGLVLLKKADVVKKLYEDLHKTYSQNPDNYLVSGDQQAMMVALAVSNIKTYILQNNWNARFIYPEKYVGKVSVLHGRHKNLEKIADAINQTDRPRVWIPWAEMCLSDGRSTKEVLKLVIKLFINRWR